MPEPRLTAAYLEKVSTQRLLKFRDPKSFLKLCEECPNYNKNYACPPLDMDAETYFTRFSAVSIFAHEFFLPSQEYISLSRSYCDKHILEQERACTGSLAFLSGTCVYCSICARAFGKPCPYPDKHRLSLDALSLNISSVCIDLFSYKLQWNTDKVLLVNALFVP